MLELLDTAPAVAVADAEYHRLLGYPSGLEPGDRARELMAWARQWYSEHGRPWVYAREASLEITPEGPRFDGVPFQSRKLHDHLQRAQATRVVVVAVGAGANCEQHAQELWQQERPDEYFFLEVFGSAVVEHLVASVSGRLCDVAARDDQIAVVPYSPGYAGWDITEQASLFELITRRETVTLPEPVEVLTSGMLRPKKTQLSVFGLTARTDAALRALRLAPCDRCSFSPCQYRRRPYRHAFGARNTPTAAVTAQVSSAVSP